MGFATLGSRHITMRSYGMSVIRKTSLVDVLHRILKGSGGPSAFYQRCPAALPAGHGPHPNNTAWMNVLEGLCFPATRPCIANQCRAALGESHVTEGARRGYRFLHTTSRSVGTSSHLRTPGEGPLLRVQAQPSYQQLSTSVHACGQNRNPNLRTDMQGVS